ncbi:VWA domain-containing protein [Mediterraneibacter sp. NSJ-55]|uniref:VWA domain-containing protein n=1 Tax=Mediterraneibacter hominis TaxID=2763054 RepID=A0A923RP49_9FIRM|nr:VWA domain-containing protein [Mediterraneibacter hominis]MBC5688124.1 VWA domain-containing protein [Mediterraneibacter hominis]
MGSGTWTREAYATYSVTKGMSVDSLGEITGSYSNQEMFKSRHLDVALDPCNVIRECCDSDEHPNTLPVILALDVTGSMGQTAVEVAKKLNTIMTELYKKVTDVEFMIMGIGDLAYDASPIQASQFESDIRIAEQLDKLYFEFGGGGNNYESYTAAWYFGARHTKLDCWNRGKRGIIITMGDERLNPYLPIRGTRSGLEASTGDKLQSDVETKDLYEETIQKFDIYHLDVNHRSGWDSEGIEASFKEYLDDKHFRRVNLNNIADEIIDIIISASDTSDSNTVLDIKEENCIAW